VVVIAVASFFMLRRRAGMGATLFVSTIIAGVPLIAWLVQLGFRLAYYSEWLPNPAHIKTHLTWARMGGGLRYVGRGLGASWLITAAGAVGAVLSIWRRETRGLGLAVVALIVVWTGYVVVIGGDHFPAFRHLLITQMCCAVLLVLGLSRWKAHGRWPLAALALVCGLAVPYVWTQRRVDRINVAHRARWQWDGQAVGETFGRAFGRERPLWAVTAAGCLPYFSRLPALDLLGLNDAHIARQPPDYSLPLAHDHGDGDYVLEREPDLITFGLPRGGPPLFKSGREMATDPRFAEDYQRVTFRTLRPISVLSATYVRRHGRVGFSGNASRLTVPAYLLRGASGHPMPDGSLGAQLARGKRTTLNLPELPTGRYSMYLEPTNTKVEVRLVSRVGRALRSDAEGTRVFVVPAATSLRIEARAPWLTTLLGSIVIERLGPAPDHAGEGHKVLVLQSAQGIGGRNRDRARPLEEWTATGKAFERDANADRARGRLTSSSFTVSHGAWLEFQIAGGRAEAYESQVGVRVIDLSADVPIPRMLFTGQNDEKPREIRADLSPLAGREARVEIFDDSSSTHITADHFVLHQPSTQR
jgi:hypothetical protein